MYLFSLLTLWSWFSRLPHLYLWLSPNNFLPTYDLPADPDPHSNTRRIISCCHQTGVPCCTYSEMHTHTYTYTHTRSLTHLQLFSTCKSAEREGEEDRRREREWRQTESEREGVGQGGGLETGQANHAYNCILTLGATGTRPLKIRLSWKHLSD